MPKTETYSFAAVGCNFHCLWCQNWEISQDPKPDKPIRGMDILPEEHVRRAGLYGCASIAYTYTEPTVFLEYALDTMQSARKKGLKNVWVTNGYMSTETLDAMVPFLDAANVDFKGSDDLVYLKYCGGKAGPVMDNLKYLYEAGVHLELTTLVVPGVNDQPDQFEKITRFIASELSPAVPWHISRFFPAWKMMRTPITPLTTLQMAESIGKAAGLKHIHIGNV